MADLIIDDGYIQALGNHYKMCAEQLQNAVDEYIKILSKATSGNVSSGEFKEALSGFLQYAAPLREAIASFGVEIENSCHRFLEEIDEKDQYIF